MRSIKPRLIKTKTLEDKILMTCSIIFFTASSIQSQMVSQKDAAAAANNWIHLIIAKEGHWAGSPEAEIKYIRDFRRSGEQLLGYFCAVQPSGFIIVSLNKALAPIRAYSETNDLDPESETGAIDLIKDQMENFIHTIQQNVGAIENAKTTDVEKILETSYRLAWQELEDGAPGFSTLNYQQGEVMLSTHWDQNPPYNEQCPEMGCNNSNGRAYVGCTATAGSQLARYWCWPPYGEDDSPYTDSYDWPNMVNQYLWDASTNFWKDERGNPLTQTHVNAMAELCAEIGTAVDMNYGCEASGAPICRSLDTDMRDALGDHFRYHTGDCEDRDDYSAGDWFNLLKNEFNQNRPVLYHVTDHSIVADGWQEVGSTPIRQYHMNYGWGESDDIWYTLDTLPLGDEDEEYALLDIHPNVILGSSISGVYPLESFPYRYFNEDVAGDNASFAAGQFLQLLPGITITCKNGSINFNATNSAPTYLFLNGDITHGIQIHSGALELYMNGSISFSR